MSYASDLHRLELRCVEYTQTGLLRLKKMSAVVDLMMIFRFHLLPNTFKVETDILTTGATLAKYIYGHFQGSRTYARTHLLQIKKK